MASSRQEPSAPGRLASSVIREGNTLRSALAPVGEPESIGAFLWRNASRLGHHPIFQEKRNGRYVAVSWEQFLCVAVSLAKALAARGIGAGDRVAVVSRNRGEMLITELAVMSLGAIYVPLYAAYSAAHTWILLTHTGASAVLVGNEEQLAKIRPTAETRLVLSFDPVGRAVVNAHLSDYSGEFALFADLLREHPVRDLRDPAAAAFLEAARALDPDLPCLMMYTSGTAGEQKGVLLTHDNILSQQRALAAIWSISSGDRFLSYLPWHHSFGGIFEKYTALYNGAVLTLDDSYGKDFPRLIENWKAVRPTVYFSVPLVHQELVNYVRVHPAEEDRIFHESLKFVFTAAAPLPAHISEHFAAKRIPVLEGWGLTETSPCCTITDMNEPRTTPGLVGYPIPGVEVAIAGDGEILVRGPNVMPGYYRNPEASRRALPGDGWFHTGDLGALVGPRLRLVARKDRVFKMLNAEKVVPTLLENRLAGKNNYIRHVLIVGAGQGYLAALLFPDYSLIERRFGDDRERADRVIKESFRQSIAELNRENPVKFEHIQAFAVVTRELTLEGDELTPSMKVRVQNVLQNSREFIEAIYSPSADCDCRFLRKVMRMVPDARPCVRGKDLTLDRCHQCSIFIFEEADIRPDVAGDPSPEGDSPPAAM